MDNPELRLERVSKSFSGVSVLKDISITIKKKGAILGLVGENGAGKSTMMNILGGVLQRDSGEMLIDGVPYNPRSAIDADERGIAFIHQELNLFPNLTIAENLYLIDAPGAKGGVLSYPAMNSAAKKVLSYLGIDMSPSTIVEALPIGMRQMVEIAKALSKNARIIVFDEPTTSLCTEEKKQLFAIIRDMSAKGISMIYISHTLEDVLALCDEVAVLRDGGLVGQLPIDRCNKADIISMMVGRKLDQLFPYVEKDPGDILLRVEGLSQRKAFRDISFSLRSGEIVGLFGLMGAGRSELASAIYGIDPVESGEISLNGEPVRNPSPEWWIKNGLAYITENRREEGLLMPKTVKENLVLANLRTMKKALGAVDRQREDRDSAAMIQRLSIKTYDQSRQSALALSGGNQQKVVIGKWLLTNPRIFLVDEPTRGVDVGAKFEIYSHLNALAKDGSAILFISSEMEELIGVCDRILVMSNGSLAGELDRGHFDQEEMLNLAISRCN